MGSTTKFSDLGCVVGLLTASLVNGKSGWCQKFIVRPPNEIVAVDLCHQLVADRSASKAGHMAVIQEIEK